MQQLLNLLKREMVLCTAATAFVVLCALAWGSPFVGAASASTAAHAQAQPQAMVFTGKVLRYGAQLMLRDSSGQVFQLDDPEHADSYEGKTVTITGSLDTTARLIHIERIGSPS